MANEKLFSMSSTINAFCKVHGSWTILSVLFFFIIALFESNHILNRLCEPEIQTTDSARGACTLNDFRDTIYYPVVAFLDKKNPYDADVFRDSYPVGDILRPYLPMTLLIHLPLGFLPFRSAATFYLLFTIVMTVLLAGLSLKLAGKDPTIGWVFTIASLILLSRPGQRNLSLGQCAVTINVGIAITLLFLQRPSVGGLGFALACYKPTYGIPFFLLLMAQGHVKTAWIGISLAALFSLPAALILVYHAGGLEPIKKAFLESSTLAQERWVSSPIASPGRIDVISVIGRFFQVDPGMITEFVIFILIVGIGAWILRMRRFRSHGNKSGLIDVGIYVLVPLTSLFHQEYDLILLILPLVLLWQSLYRSSLSKKNFHDILLMIVLLIPFLNYFQSTTVQVRLGILSPSLTWRLVASVNGVCILVALILLFTMELKTRAHT